MIVAEMVGGPKDGERIAVEKAHLSIRFPFLDHYGPDIEHGVPVPVAPFFGSVIYDYIGPRDDVVMLYRVRRDGS